MNLMFNGHMDTSNTGREDYLTGIGYKPKAVLKEWLYLRAWHLQHEGRARLLHASREGDPASGVQADGDVLIAAVVGEIEKTQWGEFVGKEYRGYGAGTHYMVNHGVLPDMCILGEPTDMQIVLAHYGSVWVRFRALELRPHRILRRPRGDELHPPHARSDGLDYEMDRRLGEERSLWWQESAL